ncbi:beta-ketoacyl-[acyl-carrier-protein] synthase family protein [candidate division KSB1 bacterium]|nr:beta-ketoacyl-[acyl-carrier-protein] synthase family protein [candidate division KSB1 bacterium]
MLPRILITGMGVISAAGVGLDALLHVLRNGRSCVRQIDTFDTSDLSCKFGAAANVFEPRDFLSGREIKRLDRSAQLFFAAGHMALADSALLNGKVDLERVGVFEGTSLGGLSRTLAEHEILLAKGAHFVNPYLLSAAMTGAGGSMLSLMHHLHGPAMAFSNGSISSACAMAAGAQQLRLHEIDAAVVGGGEAPLSFPVMALFCRAGLLSTRNDSSATACRPFDATRDGVVLGEGGAALILERFESARQRDVKIYGEVLSAAFTSEAHNFVAPAPDAVQQARALQLAFSQAAVQPDQIDCISAHGTSTPLNDRLETQAIKQAFGSRANKTPICAIKSMVGHALGACAAVETVATLLAMQQQFVPPTINLTTPDSECDLDYVPNFARRQAVDLAVVKNASFGGKNSAILLRNWRTQ